jgi:benzoate membrane transport protein
MLIAFFVLRRMKFRAPTVIALIIGIVLAALTNEIHTGAFSLALATPEWTPPIFTVQSALGLALPLFALALTTQDAPGQAVLRAEGYNAPINKALILTGLASVITAPFGGHGITLAAITAALVAGKEAHPDPDLRYAAGVSAGFWNTATGIFGTAIVALFAGLPAALIAATSGLGLFNAISAATSGALADAEGRDGALAALLCTAANFSLFGIGAPFWGLIVGLAVHWIMRARRSNWDMLEASNRWRGK